MIRVLAPLALLAAAVAVIVVVSGSIGDSDSSGDEGRRDRPGRASAPGCRPSDRDAVRAGYYVVQPGEPGLSAVADKTCIPVGRLQQLNPNLDPQLIPQGACVDLKADGCKALAGES